MTMTSPSNGRPMRRAFIVFPEGGAKLTQELIAVSL
jgi:hypothetical protein